jgi:hypothetical protein
MVTCIQNFLIIHLETKWQTAKITNHLYQEFTGLSLEEETGVSILNQLDLDTNAAHSMPICQKYI